MNWIIIAINLVILALVIVIIMEIPRSRKEKEHIPPVQGEWTWDEYIEHLKKDHPEIYEEYIKGETDS